MGFPWICIGIVFISFSAFSSPANGEFKATNECPAYQSFKNKTNPGDVKVILNTLYKIIEVDNTANPSRARIIIADAEPKERWVEKSCGEIINLVASSSSEKSDICHTPNLADSYVLALSWQPAFCELKEDAAKKAKQQNKDAEETKQECKVKTSDVYQASHFTLHGLWPNQEICGQDYGMCDTKITKVDKFCSYDPINLSDSVSKELSIFMPGANNSSCLERHEWYKHGTCQSLEVNNYYQTALRLLKEFNDTKAAALVKSHVGDSVTADDFFAAFDESFGVDSHTKLTLKCSGENLVDLYISLSNLASPNENLKTLIATAPRKFDNQCGKDFKIDAIND